MVLGRCSRRLPRGAIERLLWSLSLALFACAPALAQSSSDQPAPPGGKLLDDFVDGVHSLSADFRQDLWSADGTLIEESSGHFALKRPNRFLWNYEKPIQQEVVCDGKHLWMYDVELAQVTVTALDEPSASTPAMLLSGDKSVRDEFEIVGSSRTEGLDWVQVKPKLQGTDFRSIRIGFRDGDLARLELVDGLDQTTRIEFSNLVRNPSLEDSMFEFTVPAGVDVIGDLSGK
jgi:outer membrane lipoprotein carrier protein